MPTLTNLPPWSSSYSYTVEPGIQRTPSLNSFTRQSDINKRRVVIADVTRELQGAELPYFESFIRTLCNDGASKFVDTIADQLGLRQATIRIVDGSYSVETDLRMHTINCQIEIFG